ncbi:hypothetical protein QYM36_012133 [Artemia franciscana]|uniref:Reverse transcriptase n=1 Tax=Artemia franciscana TaxID=6661 RepID=A0AA88HNE2_ARTSF|nr:hypothetical protein QYM36_012133 [Artemia franciscana]
MNLAGKPPYIKQEIEAVRRVKSKPPLCYSCGGLYSHEHRCPAKGKTWTKFHKPNHFANVCRSKNLHEVETAEDDEGEEFRIETIDSLSVRAPEKPFVVIRLTQYNTDIKFKIYTGAEVNVLPTADFLNLKEASPRLTQTKKILTSYSGGQLKRPLNHVFYVVETDKGPIPSRQTSEKLNLIKFLMSISPEIPAAHQQRRIEVDRLLEEFSDVFDGIRQLPGTSHIQLKEGAVTTVQRPKLVPFTLQPKLKKELERPEALGVIEKTTKPTEWVNSIVLVKKGDGSLRICLDPVDINRWIKRPHHPVPLFKDIAAKFEGARKFFKVDARSGYWSMVLDDESSELTTFNTVFGRYCWKRYPFGLVSAQDDYQKKMEEALEGIEIGLVIDDIAGMGDTDEEHDRKLAEILLRAKEKGVKLNGDKCIFDATSIPYFGHILTEEGVKPDPNKTRAIRDMPAPKSKEELHKLLGMYNYLSRYIPNFSTSNQPLRDLMKAKVWKWDGIHEATRKTIQDSICKNLAYFSQHAKLTEVVTDTSQHGVGTQLLMDGATVAFASRSLSETERQYSQMEKELLAITFACKQFHQYLFGRKVYVSTDHKPLEAILSKAINRAPPILQRMMLAIKPYDLTFHYRPGKEIPVADTLSRLYQSQKRGMEHIRKVSLQDEELNILMQIIENGWPENRKDAPVSTTPYRNYRDELVVNNGLILEGERGCHSKSTEYLYGRKFTVVSDHKPLQVVLNRPISKSSPGLQRMLLRIQPYDPIIAFRPGKEILVADVLSRLNLPKEDKKMEKEIESYLHEVETAEDDEREEFRFEAIDSLSAEAPEKAFVAIRLTQYNTDIKFKIDTGAEVNVLPTADFLYLKAASPRLTKTKNILTSYSGGQLKVVGTVNLILQYKKQRPQNHVFYVVETDKGPIPSRQTSEKLNLIKFLVSISPEIPAAPRQRCIEVDRLLEEFSEVFDGIGRLPGTSHIHLKEGAVATGDGSLRICLDPVDLNRWIKRPHHPVPLFEDIAAKLEGAWKFLKVDAKSGYWSMVLDVELSEFPKFNTVFGRYRWKRYPFGLISTQDEYQKNMEEVLEGIDIGLIIDDIAGMGATD